MTREHFVEAVRKALITFGHTSAHYSGRIFRIGAAMTAAQQGIQESLIKSRNRWECTAYTLYLRTSQDVRIYCELWLELWLD